MTTFNARPDKVTAAKFLLFTLALAYLSLGFFPNAPIEGDGNGIANGASLMAFQGFGPNEFSYRYQTQTGAYVLVVWLHLATGLSTLSAFSWLSAAAMLVFLLTSTAFVHRLTGASLAVCGLALLLFQEIFTGGYYANTTVISAAFLMVAFYCCLSSRRMPVLLLAGCLLGISAWVRFDAILVMPVVILLLQYPRATSTNADSAWTLPKTTTGLARFFRVDSQGVWRAAGVLCAAALVTSVTIWLSNSSYQAILGAAQGHLENEPAGTSGLGLPLLGSSDFKSQLSIFSLLALVMSIAGVAQLLVARKWLLLGIALFGVLPFYTVYWGRMTSPKYLYYLLPFFAILIASALLALPRLPPAKRNVCLGIGLALFLLQYILGIRVGFATKSYIEPPVPTFANLLTIEKPLRTIQNVSLVIGSGTYINTDDGDRLSSGILFSPLVWRVQKQQLLADLANLSHHLAASAAQPLVLMTDQYRAKQLALNFLLNEGYTCTAEKNLQVQKYDCVKAGRRAQLLALTPLRERRIERMAELIEAVGTANLVFIVPTPWEQNLLQQYLAQNETWQGREINSFAYELQKRPQQ